MANSELKPVHVPMLRPKLGVLYMFSPTITTDTAFAQSFASDRDDPGRSSRMIRNWITGYNAAFGPNHVPGERFPEMVEIFRKELPGGRKSNEVAAFLTSDSPAGLFQAFAEGQPTDSWIALVAGADKTGVRLVAELPPGHLGLTRRGPQFRVTEDWVQAKINQWFRFEFAASAGWLAALQWGPEGWCAVELDDKAAVVELRDERMRFPAQRDYLTEDVPSARRYIFLWSDEPFAPFVRDALNLSAFHAAMIDAPTLTRLAAMKSNVGGFRITALDVAFHE